MAQPEFVMSFAASEPRTGGWCDQCALPSLMEIDLSILTNTTSGTPVSAHSETRTVCVEHDEVGDDRD